MGTLGLGVLGPWGPLGLGDPLALGDPWALGTLGLGDPWALGGRGPWARILSARCLEHTSVLDSVRSHILGFSHFTNPSGRFTVPHPTLPSADPKARGRWEFRSPEI